MLTPPKSSNPLKCLRNKASIYPLFGLNPGLEHHPKFYDEVKVSPFWCIFAPSYFLYPLSTTPISRRQIRTLVFQALYAREISGESYDEVFQKLLEETWQKVLLQKPNKGFELSDADFLKTLYYNSLTDRELYDEWIKTKAANWEIHRIAILDRLLMYMALYEILHFHDVPVKVSLNEYLEIAKEFSTPKSNHFINGILDNIQHQLKAEGKIEKRGRGLRTN